MILIYFFKVLSFSINAFVHSNKPVFEIVIKIFFRETVNSLFESSLHFIVVVKPNTYVTVSSSVSETRRSHKDFNLENMPDFDIVRLDFPAKIH